LGLEFLVDVLIEIGFAFFWMTVSVGLMS